MSKGKGEKEQFLGRFGHVPTADEVYAKARAMARDEQSRWDWPEYLCGLSDAGVDDDTSLGLMRAAVNGVFSHNIDPANDGEVEGGGLQGLLHDGVGAMCCETLDRLGALELNGGSHENLNEIARAIYPDAQFGWTGAACHALVERLCLMLVASAVSIYDRSGRDDYAVEFIRKPTDEEVDNLRRRLRRRGVEFFMHESVQSLRDEDDPIRATSWHARGANYTAIPDGRGTFDVWIDHADPEQAVGATYIDHADLDQTPCAPTSGGDGDDA